MPFQRRTSLKIVAAVLGTLVAGAPIVLVDVWLKRQGESEVANTAAWALGSTEIRLGQAADAIQQLAARGVDSCAPAHIELMRQTALRTGPVKQVMLIGRNGEIACTDMGAGPGSERHQMIASAPVGETGLVLEAVQLGEHRERFLRLRKAPLYGKPTPAALVPVGVLLPQASPESRLLGSARLAMADGTPLGVSGTAAAGEATPEAQFIDHLRSKKYPLLITVAMARTATTANYDGLRHVAMVVTGGVVVVMLLFAALGFKRPPGNAAAEMAKAIADDEFVPYYQPLVDLQTGRLLGAEVLVRWRRDGGDVVEPNSFILMLESSGLVLDFTRKLMRRVCSELNDAVGRRPKLTLAFNVAPRHFDDALILHDVGTIFDSSDIRLSQIVLELTERHEVTNLAGMRRTIAALQRVGCKVAIDDVGTGHSGLAYILKLGVDIIKIDKVFVESIGGEGHSKAIIETLIDLAKNMRMEIVAEGVETFDQVSYLRERGIGAAQGYVFAPPLPAETFMKLLEAMDPVGGSAAPSAIKA